MSKKLFSTRQILILLGLFIFSVLIMSIQYGLQLLSAAENYDVENTLINAIEYWSPIVSFIYYIPLFIILIVLVVNFGKDQHKTTFHILLIFVLWITNLFISKGFQFSQLSSDIENGANVSNWSGHPLVYDFIFPFLWIVVPATLSAFLKKRKLFYYFLLLFIMFLLAFLTGSYLSEDWVRSIALYLLELI